MITVTNIKSVFTLRDREITTTPWRLGMVVSDVVMDDCPYAGVDFAYSVNGRVVGINHCLVSGDHVAVCPVPQDGGDLLRTVAMIAVTIAATMVAGPAAGWATSSAGLGLGYNASVAFGYAVATAVAVGGAYAVNSVLPPSAPDIPQIGRDSFNESPTYGWGALVATERQGPCIPILFGKARCAGHIINRFVEVSGKKQYYNVLIGVADGANPITITDVEINDQPVANFDGVTVYTREGGINDAVIPGFDEVVAQQDFANKLVYNNAVQAQTQGNAVQRIEIDISAPYGMYYSNNQGTLDERSATIRVEYRELGSETWLLHSNKIISGRTTAAIRETIKITVVAGQDEIQLTRTNPESTSHREKSAVYFVSLREVVKRELIYPGLAKVGVTAMATDQLSGGVPAITLTAERAEVDVWNPYTEAWDTENADNPGWAYYALANTHHGIDKTKMLYDEIKEFADYCDEDRWGRKRYRLGLMLDTTADFWTQAMLILQIGRAIPVRRGTSYGLVAEMPSTPVQMFNMASVLTGTFKMGYISLPDRPNACEITYKDEDEDFNTTTIAAYADDYDDSLQDNRVSKRLYGCPNREQAIAEAAFVINSNNELIRTVEFDVDIEALALQVGDLFYFNHEVPTWGSSGRIVAAGLGSIEFDKAVTYNAGGSYAMLLRASDDTLFDKAVYICTSSEYTVFAQATEPTATGTGDWWVDTDSPYNKWRWDGEDWIDAVSFVDDATDTSVAILTTPFSSGDLAKLAKYDSYTIGITGSYKRIYRCVSTARAGDLSRNVKGAEYNAALLDKTKVIELADRPLDFNRAYGVFAHEYMAYTADGSYRSNIAAAWHSQATIGSQTWEVWLKDLTAGVLAGGPFITSALDFVFPSGLVKLNHNYMVYISVPGRGAVNTGDNTAEVYINGKDDPPPDVETFTFQQMADGTRRFEFAMERPIDFAGYQLRYKLDSEATWAEMADLTDGLVKVSPFETNELAAGTYVFGVKAVDTSGNESENDTQIVAELGDPRLGAVVAAVYPSGVWPGTKTNCWHDDHSGWLVAADTKTWADFATDVATWEDWTTWARVPATTISYEHTVIDLSASLPVTPLVTVVGVGTQTIEMSTSDDNITWSSFGALGFVTARYFKFKATLVAGSGVTAIIKTMQILLAGAAITEEISDLDTSTLSATYRVAAGHIYVPLTKGFNVVTQVQLALQSVTAGWSWVIIDKTHTVSGEIAPEIKIYNGSGVLADAVIDVFARGA